MKKTITPSTRQQLAAIAMRATELLQAIDSLHAEANALLGIDAKGWPQADDRIADLVGGVVDVDDTLELLGVRVRGGAHA